MNALAELYQLEQEEHQLAAELTLLKSIVQNASSEGDIQARAEEGQTQDSNLSHGQIHSANEAQEPENALQQLLTAAISVEKESNEATDEVFTSSPSVDLCRLEWFPSPVLPNDPSPPRLTEAGLKFRAIFPVHLHQLPLSPIAWTATERECLNACVLKFFKDVMMKQVFEAVREAELHSNQNGVSSNLASLKIISSDLLELPGHLLSYVNPENMLLDAQQRINNMTLSDFLGDIQRIDWNIIASMKNEIRLLHPSTKNDPFPTRSAYDCKIEWISRSDPRINLTSFTSDEDKALIKLARQYEERNWPEIARALGSNRTPIQCLQRYQRTLNTNFTKTKWTADEDDRLLYLVNNYGDQNWPLVSKFMSQRTAEQCKHRWMKSVDPTLQYGSWTKLETERLDIVTRSYQHSEDFHPSTRQKRTKTKHLEGSLVTGAWNYIAQHCPGRTDVKCRERWVNTSHTSSSSSLPFEWTNDLDLILVDAVKSLGRQWSLIANLFPGRSDTDCRDRFRSLSRKLSRKSRLNKLSPLEEILNQKLRSIEEMTISNVPPVAELNATKLPSRKREGRAAILALRKSKKRLKQSGNIT